MSVTGERTKRKSVFSNSVESSESVRDKASFGSFPSPIHLFIDLILNLFAYGGAKYHNILILYSSLCVCVQRRESIMASCTSTSLPGASSKVYFRPALFWQQVQPWHIADAGLEFRMNFATQKNEARFPSGVEFEPGTDRIMALRQEACRLVPDSDARDDSVALEKRLCDAATWGQDDN